MASTLAPSTSSSGTAGVVVMPGDILDVTERSDRAGLGLLRPAAGGIRAAAPGVLRRGGLAAGAGGSKLLWVDNVSRRYHPQVDDMVIGTIVEKHSELYRVDIGLSQPAVLPALAFEGASKRNKPNLEVGQLMYMRVRVANKHTEVELTCTSPLVKTDWVNQGALFGPLNGGFVFTTTGCAARGLMDNDHPVLELLGTKLAFELAIGANGRVWVNAEAPAQTIVVANILQLAETRTPEQLAVMLDRAIKAWSVEPPK